MSRHDQPQTAPDPRAAAAFAVECPDCRAHLAAAPTLAGGAAVCPACQAAFLVPRTAPAMPATAPVVFAEPPLPSTRRRPDDAFVVPAVDTAATGADTAPFAVHEPARKVTTGDVEVELRRLTPDERRRRRAGRNLLILVVGAALLVALVVMLATGGR